MLGASSLDAVMQLAEWYDALFSKQQRNPDLQNAGQVKGHNPQNKSAKKGKPRYSGSSGASTSENN